MASDLREAIEFPEGLEDGFGLPKIIVVGCGGAGNNTISRLAKIDLEGARTVAIWIPCPDCGNTEFPTLETMCASRTPNSESDIP